RAPPAWAWILIAGATLVLGAWLAVVIVLSPGRATQLVRAELARSLRREVRFEGLAISLWPPVRIAVQRVELAEPGGFERGSAFAAQAIDLDVDAFALFARRVRVRRLVLDGPALHVLVRPDGSTNFDSLQAAPATRAGAPPALDLDIRELDVRG